MELSGKRFLVIGGAGFIGSHIVDQLTQTDAREIIVYDNFCRGARSNLAEALKDPRVSVFDIGGDVLQTDILSRAMEGIDGVFHLAALWLLQCYDYPRAAFDVNIRGTFNVAEAAIAAGVKRVVYSSSASVYGNALEIPMTENHVYNNETFYGATKICGEHIFKSLGCRYGLNWVGLRYMNVYGSRQDYKGTYTAVIHKVLDRIEAGQPPLVYGDGSQQYDFIDVRDTARANLLAMQADVNGECYNVGRGIGTTIKELAELILQLTDCHQKIQYEPAGRTFVTNRIGCPKKADRDLGFRWQIELEDGLRDLIDWRQQDRVRTTAAEH
ncbi:MAG TPA: NAD-dependent epimerase/dehydratase family protein [candidate division Zixibacteria bacterium]|nr:NAD-dependent epimerase/dehydratase family protein [candidate division Zixibacteria bacterium]